MARGAALSSMRISGPFDAASRLPTLRHSLSNTHLEADLQTWPIPVDPAQKRSVLEISGSAADDAHPSARSDLDTRSSGHSFLNRASGPSHRAPDSGQSLERSRRGLSWPIILCLEDH